MSRWLIRAGYVIGGIGFALALTDYLPVGAVDLVTDLAQGRPRSAHMLVVPPEYDVNNASALLLVTGLALLAAGLVLKRRGR